MRKLASIRKVSKIEPIEKADSLELAHVDGWQCVVGKGQFKEGDEAIYFEIDSFLPVLPEFEFLRKNCFRSTKHLGEGFRIKTMKLRGVISQGLLMPLTGKLGEQVMLWDTVMRLVEDMEGNSDNVKSLDDFLGIKKWEVPVSPSLAGQIKGNFPSFIRKTDQERIQNCYDSMAKKYKDEVFSASVKLDGSSMTVYYNNGEFGVCSRNLDIKESEDNTFWKVANKTNLKEALPKLGRNIAIQGELMGPGIQGNREKLSDHELFVFDVWDVDKQEYCSVDNKQEVLSALKQHGAVLSEVPIAASWCFPFQDDLTMEELLKISDETKSLTNPVAEGIVYRSVKDPNVSFKVISNKFLLKEE